MTDEERLAQALAEELPENPENQEAMAEAIGDAIEEAYGTKDPEEFQEMVEEGDVNVAAVAEALKEEFTHDDLAEIVAELLLTEASMMEE